MSSGTGVILNGVNRKLQDLGATPHPFQGAEILR
jgi:hypothetical protein